MSHPVHVIAVVGTAPAVVTELLWWLVEQDQSEIRGVELWTTVAGARALRERAGLWAGLRDIPPPPEREHTQTWLAEQPCLGTPPELRIIVPFVDDRLLEDVRTPSDTEEVGRLLHDRVRRLRAELGSVQLVGSLAGGRKTMGSALQSAFSLQARPEDRLVHVLTHPAIVGPDLRNFTIPDPSLPIPLDQQVAVHEVLFPPLRTLMENLGQGHHFDQDYAEVLGEIRRVSGLSTRAELRYHGLGEPAALVLLEGPRVLSEVQLPPSLAEVYAALVRCEGEALDARWWEVMVSAPRWSRRDRLDGFDRETNQASKKLSLLRKELSDWTRHGHTDFVPETDPAPADGENGKLRRLSGWRRVRLIGTP